jgi:hypothetical protein
MIFTNKQKLAEIRRELALRARVYPERIALGRMTLEEGERFVAIMLAIANDYERLIEKDEPRLFEGLS